jgi:hypothetical protein
MSIVDSFYCECEKAITETLESIPTYIAKQTLHLGDRIFDEETREKLIENCKSNTKELKRYKRELKSQGDGYTHDFNENIFWAYHLSPKLNDRRDFEITVLAGRRGTDPVISKEDERMLLESYGLPQLREYIEKRRIEAEIAAEQNLKNISEILKETAGLANQLEDNKKAIEALKNFKSFVHSLGNTFDLNLSDRFRQRMFLARNGVRLKVS